MIGEISNLTRELNDMEQVWSLDLTNETTFFNTITKVEVPLLNKLEIKSTPTT